MLEHIGEDPKREGLLETPARVVKSWKALFGGYGIDPAGVFKTFSEGACDEMVLLRDVEFYSTFEHHIIPFHGTASIAYIPNKKVIGVSKLVRLLEVYARRLQIQERLCQQVTAALDQYLQPLGSACVLNAQHMCMTARGVQKQGSRMVTSSLTGVFKTNPQTRAEFLQLVGA
jgi:GTP cyclohydrolase I